MQNSTRTAALLAALLGTSTSTCSAAPATTTTLLKRATTTASSRSRSEPPSPTQAPVTRSVANRRGRTEGGVAAGAITYQEGSLSGAGSYATFPHQYPALSKAASLRLRGGANSGAELELLNSANAPLLIEKLQAQAALAMLIVDGATEHDFEVEAPYFALESRKMVADAAKVGARDVRSTDRRGGLARAPPS